jgi:hypothetical protein
LSVGRRTLPLTTGLAVSAARTSASLAPVLRGVVSMPRTAVPLNSARVCASTACGVNSGSDFLKIA